MNKLALTLFFAIALSWELSLAAESPTVSDLARHLQIRSWSTKVDVPAGTFGAAVLQVRDGKVINTAVGGIKGPCDDSDGQRLVIFADTLAKGTTVTLILGASSITNRDAAIKPQIDLTGAIGLPSSVTVGTYVLGGQFRTEGGSIVASRDPEDLVSGLVLRIYRDEAEQGAAANP